MFSFHIGLACSVGLAFQVSAFLRRLLGDPQSFLVVVRGFLALPSLHELLYDIGRLCSTAWRVLADSEQKMFVPKELEEKG